MEPDSDQSFRDGVPRYEDDDKEFAEHVMTMDNEIKQDGIISTLAAMSADTLIDEAALAKIFGRCPTTIKRAIRRGELPPGVRLFGKSTWTAKAILEHLERRLDEAKRDRERLQKRVSALVP